MRRDFFDALHCPYSGSRFVLNTVLGESASAITYAIATSEAGDFPIVDGILRLRVDEYRRPLVDLIKNHKPGQALLTALDAPFYGPMGPALELLDRAARTFRLDGIATALTALKRPMSRALTDTTGTFARTMKSLKSKSWGIWQTQRFSMPHFLPIYPLLHLVEDTGPVLDFGCGLGHSSFLMSRRVQESRITCADARFHALYLARQFFVRNANFVCIDGDYLLPFDSAYFSLILSSDVLHFIDSKLSLSQEFRRILSERGTIVLPHLHNNLSSVNLERAVSPEGYSALFAGIDKRLMAEESIVAEFIASDSLDLEKDRGVEELHDAVKGLSLVASQDSSLFRRHSGLWRRYVECMVNPIVNPVYQFTERNGRCELKKQISDDNRGKAVPGDNAYLPDTAVVPLASLDRESILSLKMSDPSTFSELTRQFVFVDAPERFQ